MTLTKATYSMIDGAPLNVLDFGAKGDYNPDTGTGTDDTAAFQAAFNYARDKSVTNDYTTKCEIFIPEGFYKISSTLFVYGRTRVNGAGTIVYTGTGVGLNLSPGDVSQRYIELSGFGITTTNAGATVAIYSLNNIRCSYFGLKVLGDPTTGYGVTRWSVAGIQLDTTAALNTFLINIQNCVINRIKGDCILFTGAGGQDMINITGCALAWSDGCGIRHIDPGYAGLAHLNVSGNEIEGFETTAIWLQYVLNSVISHNHFEYAAPTSFPIIKLGDTVIASGISVLNNSISRSNVAAIEIYRSADSQYSFNRFAGPGYAFSVVTAMADCSVTSNTLSSGAVLFTPTSSQLINTTEINDPANISTQRYKANVLYDGIGQRLNGSIRGAQTVKPGDTGSNYYKAQYGEICAFNIGDIIFNANPTSGGHIGWVCVSNGYAHLATNGNLTSGSNVITSVTGAIYDWESGDLICTDTNALGIPVGTTVVSKTSNTITLSANATANGTAVSLYGARFKTWGVIS